MRKLIKYIYKTKLIVFITNLPFIIVEFFIHKKLIFVPISPKNRISLYVESTEFILRRNKKNKFKLIFLDPNKNLIKPNAYLYNVLKNKNFVFEYASKINKIIVKIFLLLMERISPKRLYIYNNGNTWLDDNKPHICFSKKEVREGNELLSNLNIKKNYIILNLREKIYYESINNNKDNFATPNPELSELYSFRNPEIKEYFKAIEFLNKKSIQTVKTGVLNPKISNETSTNNLFINYPNSVYKSDFNDIFLHSESLFSIVGCSGSWAYSYLFNKPVVKTNDYAGPFSATFNKDIYIPALFFNLNKNKYLTFDEMCALRKRYNQFLDSETLKKLELKLIHNTKDEILKASEEMLNILTKKNIFENEEYKKLNNEFLKIKKLSGIEFFKKSNGSISPYFLKKYETLIN